MNSKFEPTASLDPWCLVPLKNGEQLLYGFALQHPRTRGLSWMVSTTVRSLDEVKGRAVTESGRVYALGRQFIWDDIIDEGAEAAVAYSALLALEPDAAPPLVVQFNWYGAARWLTACKIARHLKLTPPQFLADDYEPFIAQHREQYCGLMRSDRLC